MNQSILNEIAQLRSGAPLRIDPGNSNRYRVLVREDSGTATAYCFSAPIYRRSDRRLVSLRLTQSGGTFAGLGSNCSITAAEGAVRLQNEEGGVAFFTGGGEFRPLDRGMAAGPLEIYPALNGIAVKAFQPSLTFDLKMDRPFPNIRENPKCFALMSEEFRPFMSVSAIGAYNAFGRLHAPLRIQYQKIDAQHIRLTAAAPSELSRSIFFEINLYEPKLFQDTTVESKNPGENNAFGGTAYLGTTECYGEQWLYTRPDVAMLQDLCARETKKVTLHLPRFCDTAVPLTASGLTQRFCSFGSNWENKVAAAAFDTRHTASGFYHSVDVSSFWIDRATRTLSPGEGLLLRPYAKGGGYTAVSTGDNYFSPQILEITYS